MASHNDGFSRLPNAEKVLEIRNAFQDGTILVIRVWLLPTPVPPSLHRFKYSFFFGRPGGRLVLFDNERGKGDHILNRRPTASTWMSKRI
jgi:hypothetical protein